MITKVQNQKDKEPCSSFYVVRYGKHDYHINLWAIVGGELAFAFCTPHLNLDSPFVRLNYSEQHDSKKHPKYKEWNPVAPEHYEYDGLTGEAAILKLVSDLVPAYTLQKIRENFVRDTFGYELKSRRFHDKENATYLRCSVGLNGYVSPVTYLSKYYAGRCDDRAIFTDSKWQEAAKVLNPWHDMTRPKAILYSSLTADDFSRYLDVITTLV